MIFHPCNTLKRRNFEAAGRILAIECLDRTRVSIFPEKNFQPGTWNNPEKHLGTRNSGFQPGTRNYPEIFPSSNPELGKISGSNLEPGKISGFQPRTRKNFRVPTRNTEKFPGSNPEHGKISGFQPGTRKNFQVPTRNPEHILFPLKTQPPAPPFPLSPCTHIKYILRNVGGVAD